jgi:SAM-dependent methyltransferase
MISATTPNVLDDVIVLDPAVWIEELAARPPSAWSQGPAVRRGWLLVHDALETAAVMPPGRGLRQFVEGLRSSMRLGELVAPAPTGSDLLALKLIDNLTERGFAHRVREGARSLDERDLERLREAWRERCRHARRRLRIASPAEDLAARLRASPRPPSLVLACDGEASSLAAAGAVADALERGDVHAHEVVVELWRAGCGAALRAALRRLGARVRLHAERGTFDVALARELAREHIAVAVRADAGPDQLRDGGFEELARAVTAARVTTLELDVAWARFSSDGRADGDLASEIYGRIRALADELGDVRIAGFPDDDEIIQDALAEPRLPPSDLERAARRIHLAQRARYLVDIEGRSVWAQDPPAEELWVPSKDDLLPNRPELLGIGEGSVVADIAGGFGRVARRLAPLVGAAGLVISIEKQPLFSSRARRYAGELGARTIRFHIGLGQRVPLDDDSVDAAVLEWGGEIHRDGLLAACIAEMKRIVRPGKRIAITYRLCNLRLDKLSEVFAPAPEIYPVLLEAVARAGLPIVAEELWVVRPRLAGAPMASFEERFVPRLLDDLRDRRLPEQPPAADVTLTVIAEK